MDNHTIKQWNLKVNLLSWLIYVPLQICWLPISILGGILVAYKQLIVSKRLGLSQTAIEVFNGRWTMEIFDMRADPAIVQLGTVLPNTSTLDLWMALFPLWIKWKISGVRVLYPRSPLREEETLADLFTARTKYFDALIEKHISSVE
jgi:hypothetical protein